MIKKILAGPRTLVLMLIRLYQKTISPDHGFVKILFPYGFCKFSPSCSEYGYQAISKYGLLRGVPMGIWRVLRCNPFTKGGDDPVN